MVKDGDQEHINTRDLIHALQARRTDDREKIGGRRLVCCAESIPGAMIRRETSDIASRSSAMKVEVSQIERPLSAEEDCR